MFARQHVHRRLHEDEIHIVLLKSNIYSSLNGLAPCLSECGGVKLGVVGAPLLWPADS